MKIITWNCQGAFRKKYELILLEKPDILIIQECEHPSKLLFNDSVEKPRDILWFGDNSNKGICIFSFWDFELNLLENYNSEIRYIIPIWVSNKKSEFTLFAIWANNRLDKYNQYIEQIWKALHFYENLLENKNIIITWDFNSNKIWDKKHQIGNHTDVIDKLISKNIHSIYHKQHNEIQWEEKQPTFFLQRNKDKPYHIDYCFVTSNLLENIQEFRIGIYENFKDHSDHLPLITTINF